MDWLLNRPLLFWSQITFTHQMNWSSQVHNEFFLSLSFDVVFEGELHYSRDSVWRTCVEYDPGFLHTFLCEIQADLIAFPSMLKVLSIHLSSNVGAFGFRWCLVAVWVTPSGGPNVHLFMTYLFARWWSLTRNWVSSSLHVAFVIRWNVNRNRRWINLFISRCSCVFVCTLVSEPSSAWGLGFCTFGNIQIITSCLPLAIFFRFTQSSLFAFHDRLQVLVCPFAFLSSLHFPSPFEFRCGEPVGESERDRPFRLPFLLGSCLNAHASPNGHVPFVVQRMQSPLSELLLACSSPFSFCIAPSSLLLYVCNHLVFSHWNENLWFSARGVFGPSTSICNSCRSCRQMPSPERKCSTSISTLLTFQLASCTESPISCQ